eukprot:scaffold16034_cov38-Cyclotella_meneghiniana.AAC.5
MSDDLQPTAIYTKCNFRFVAVLDTPFTFPPKMHTRRAPLKISHQPWRPTQGQWLHRHLTRTPER